MKKLKKEKGLVEISVCIYIVMIFCVFVYANVNYNIYKSIRIHAQDALADSISASMVADLMMFDEQSIVILDVDKIYDIFTGSLKSNMGVDDGSYGLSGSVISYRVVKLMVYNVYSETDTRVYTYDDMGNYSMLQYGSYQELNGAEITSSTVYAEMAYEVDGIFGLENIEQQIAQSMSYKK